MWILQAINIQSASNPFDILPTAKAGVLDALYHVQAKNDYWENDGESLTDLIHKYRWYILKDALMQRGRDAVTDFIGTDISSSEFSRVLDETEMVMPDETFEKFWEKYI